MINNLAWSPDFKALINTGALPFSYLQFSSQYVIFIRVPEFAFFCFLVRDGGSDVTDFENNFKSSAVTFVKPYINSYTNLTGNATTTVKSGAGILHRIICNNASTGGTATIYDNTAGSGTKIGTLSMGTPSGGLLSGTGNEAPVSLDYRDLQFGTGLTIVTAGSTSNDFTIVYR